MPGERKYDAVVFDLLTALIDSWTLWNQAAGSAEDGLRWRREYLALTYAAGPYRPYADIVRQAAARAGIEPACVDTLLAPVERVAALAGDAPRARRRLPGASPSAW